MTTSAPRHHPVTPPEEPTIVSAPPRADCIADSAGGLTFDVDVWGRPESTGDWTAALVLRRRVADADADSDEVRLPLSPNGDGRLRAVLPSTVALPEGRWDIHVACGEDDVRRLVPGLNDLRSLVDRTPSQSTSPLAVRIPYATKHGNLSLRSWLRVPHAEAADIQIESTGITARGVLYRVQDPQAWLAGAVVEARCRRDADLVHTVPTTAEGQEFAFTLPYGPLAEAWRGGLDVWDLWLRPADGEPVRIARILDDIADKKPVFVYPVRPVAADHAPAQAGPYYTADNDLSVRIDEREPAAR
ncbi:hypothetical protein ACFU99_32105 [Streptomyces sp. NPDC057654]|uniref:hypothetical protein n=1 Tax=Streptomyces sp. NPDC057654 TaxID=3346196 RepID=UPI0036B194A7